MSGKKLVKKKPESKESAIQTALRYLENAKETLAKSPIENDRYQDEKYVREACCIAYLAALIAIEGWMVERDLWSKTNTNSVEAYQQIIQKHPQQKRLNDYFVIVYDNIHLAGYYNGATSVALIKDGFKNVKNIIDLVEKGF